MDLIKRVLIDGDTSEIGSAPDGRRHGRWCVDELECRFDKKGRALLTDLSATGMRLEVRGKFEHKPGESFQFELRWQETSLKLAGKIVWVEPVARKHCLAGVRFEDTTPQQITELREMAKLARDARMM
jgi:hypothetical protein